MINKFFPRRGKEGKRRLFINPFIHNPYDKKKKNDPFTIDPLPEPQPLISPLSKDEEVEEEPQSYPQPQNFNNNRFIK